MAQYTINDLERLAAIGRGSGADTLRDQTGSVTFYSPPPQPKDIKQEIYKFVLGADKYVSRAEIAKHLELKKTKWLFDHCEWLVEHGYLVRTETMLINRMIMYWYAVARGQG